MTLKLDEIAEDFQLVFLDANINELDDYDDIKDYLQFIRPYIHTFTDMDACLEHLASSWFYHTFLVVSDRSVFNILFKIEKMNHITSLFIFCENIMPENLRTICPRILRGVFNNKQDLMVKLIKNIPTKRTACVHERNVFLYADDDMEKSLTDADDMNVVPFLTAIIQTNDPRQRILSTSTSKDEMLTECRLFYKNDKKELQRIKEFEDGYDPTMALDWYMGDTFVYRIVNKALRTQKPHIIDKFRFFIKDLEETLDLIFAKQTFDQWSSSCPKKDELAPLYRGQRLSQADMQRLQKCLGKHIILNQFISTTKDVQLAEVFAGTGEDRPHFESVIYEIDISIIYENYKDKPDPCIYYYDISHFNQGEEEVILRIGTVFKVVNVSQVPDSTWRVKLRVEKVDDYRTSNKVNRTPVDVVHSFFSKAAQMKEINIDHIIRDNLSSSTLLATSVFIRLGHLVKHHPREQLRYYQAALSNIPSNESTLIELGYWAIRMRCFLHVNDWTSIPLNIYRQTALHISGKIRKTLHLELARIDEARGAFCSAKKYYDEVLKYTNDPTEKQLISDDIKQLNDKDNEPELLSPSSEYSFRHLYVAILTIAERTLIDDECTLFHQAINSRPSIVAAILPDLSSHREQNRQNELIRNLFINIEYDSTVRPLNQLFVLTLTDESLTLMVDKNLRVGQLKEKIRDNYDVPYPSEYDFCLIHYGKILMNEQLSLSDYQINHEDIVYLIHGPRIQNTPLNSDEQLAQGTTDRNIQSLEIMQRKIAHNIMRMAEDNERRSVLTQNLLRNLLNLETPSIDTVNNEFNQLNQSHLSIVQYNDEDDADPVGLSNMSVSLAEDCIRNSGPQTSLDQVDDILRLCARENSVDSDNNQPLDVERDIDEYNQVNNEMMWQLEQLKQAMRDHALNASQLLLTSDCVTS